jgi:CRISPR-associated protein Csm2
MMDNIATMSPAELVRRAEEIAVQLTRDRLKTGQIRNFYSSIIQMRTQLALKEDEVTDELKRDLTMLKPKIAYAAGRQTAVRATFYPFVKGALDGIEKSNYNVKGIKNFFQLIESIIAYHKFYGGSE